MELSAEEKKTSWLYRAIKWLVNACYPEMQLVGLEYLPEGECILVGNHTQMHGPIASELYLPGKHHTWCAAQMMHLKEVPSYAYQDFWSRKPTYIRWFYKLLSYIIAPLSVCIFNNANTIGVYHDARIVTTFKTTIKKLQEGSRIVIFPEHDEPYNHILCQFQDKFIDVARLYYKRTKKELFFVPLYIAPALRKLYFGKPIQYCAANTAEEERRRICNYLMEEITQIACNLPEHRVVPYNNVPKREYPSNIPKEEIYEKTGG